MTLKHRVSFGHNDLLDQIKKQVIGQCKLYEIDGEDLTDISSIYWELVKILPIGIPLQSVNWDAFTDSVWEGLAANNSDSSVVLIWKNAHHFAEENIGDFYFVCDVLQSLSGTLLFDNKHKVLFYTIVLGASEAFAAKAKNSIEL